MENLSIPTLTWLGVLPSDIDTLHLPEHVALDLTTRDRAQLQDMMNRGYMKDLAMEVAEVSTAKHFVDLCLAIFFNHFFVFLFLFSLLLFIFFSVLSPYLLPQTPISYAYSLGLLRVVLFEGKTTTFMVRKSLAAKSRLKI